MRGFQRDGLRVGTAGVGGKSILKRESTAVAGGSGAESVTEARIFWNPKGTVMALWRGTKFGSRDTRMIYRGNHMVNLW